MFIETKQTQTDIMQQIALLKEEKRKEIELSQKRMQTLMSTIIEPQKDNSAGGMMKYVQTGIAAYDGIMTGVKMYRRIRRFFKK